MSKLNVRKVLYQFRWQKLRTTLDFSSITHVETSLAELRRYLGGDFFEDSEYNRVYRVLNLLAAVRMGIQGRIKLRNGDEEELQAMDREVDTYRCIVSTRYEALKSRFSPTIQTDAEQLRELREAHEHDHSSFMRVNKSLQERLVRTKNPENREELVSYLSLMARVIAESKEAAQK